MDGPRRSERRRLQQFFVELNPVLEAARKLERELDRHLAHRFNVFNYMGEDHPSEVLLSRIIGDLLNPAERHGQGTSLLGLLLERLPAPSGTPKPRPDFSKPVRVQLERLISGGRLIDITVDVATGAGPWCLAIENKPFAGDQPNQVRDYLKYLKDEYEDRFLLIYLSPRGEGPTDYSLPKEELPRWRGRLVVMPYWRDPESAGREGEYAEENEGGLEDEEETGAPAAVTGGEADDAPEDEQTLPDDVFADFRTRFSLADWFAACRTQCHADRLRWFLRDAEEFCRQQFGGHSMATDSDTRAIQDYLFANPNQLETAQTVWDVWPKLKDELCGGFLEHLRVQVDRKAQDQLFNIAPDLRVEYRYGGERKWSNFLWLYRTGWPAWDKPTKNHPPVEGCTGVVLQSLGPGPNHWRWGVLHPLDKNKGTGRDKERRKALEDRLRRHLEPCESLLWWPYVCQVRDEMTRWDSLLPNLYREWKDGGGSITDYYVKGMIDLATKAIPIIEEVERKWDQPEA
ncbi:PD-(D/E)XK nuclease family protein [Candidatus Palauibacter sp.]|uniref:PDDEXK-like family protein n=1 Tax=Candidatus Palauibacter sp. TaxID=3101350 RepID=UPI003D121AB1